VEVTELSSALRRALRLIEVHPSVVSVTADSIEGSSAVIAMVQIRTELPNEWHAAGRSPGGVKPIETVTFIFPAGFPTTAPRIWLRMDFDRSHPHLLPRASDRYPEPCLVVGSLRELLRRRGITGILEQLVEWLERAAYVCLVDPASGWEPVRRDSIDDFIVADAHWVRSLADRNGGSAVLASRFFWSGSSDTYRVRVIKSDPIPVNDELVSTWKFRNPTANSRSGNGHCIVAWSGRAATGGDFVASRYLPESVVDVASLLERARVLGCGEFLEAKLGLFALRLQNMEMSEPVPTSIILLARRPCCLIAADSPIELCPYLVEIKGNDDLSRSSTKPVRIAMHREEISIPLLRRTSGDADRTVTPPWTLLGCGSVGSKIALHLARAGRGPSAVVDPEFMEPHNFARHGVVPRDTTSDALWLERKATMLSEALESLGQPASAHVVDVVTKLAADHTLEPIVQRDAFALVNTTAASSVREALCDLTVAPTRPRIFEACLLGLGRVAVCTIEGPNANPSSTDLMFLTYQKLHADQVLRKLVFNTKAEEIAVGQGCSAVTLSLTDARISAFTGPIAEQLIGMSRSGLPPNGGQILLCRIDDEGLNLTWQRFAVEPWVIVPSSDKASPSVRISASAHANIIGEVARYPNSETGGILVGCFSEVTNAFHVLETMRAPPDSRFSKDEFVLGTKGLRPKLLDLIEGSGGALYALGTWHNHLVPSGPSLKDIRTAALLAIRQRFPLLMLIHTPAGYVALTAEVLSTARTESSPSTSEQGRHVVSN
jgi:hypothetical protein